VVVRVVLQTHVPQSALQLPPRVWFADTPQLLGVLHESDIIGAFTRSTCHLTSGCCPHLAVPVEAIRLDRQSDPLRLARRIHSLGGQNMNI
jgi:hypothetical protein